MNIEHKKKILEKLAQLGDPKSLAALTKEAEKIGSAIGGTTNYDVIEPHLEMLDIFAYREYQRAFDIVTALLNRLETLKLTYDPTPGFPTENREQISNKNTLAIHGLELLKHIRYHLPDDILALFLRYSAHKSSEIRKEALTGLKSIADYDLDIFYGNGKDWKGLGPEPQQKIITYIEKCSVTYIKQHLPGIIALCESLLSPAISGTSWSYQKVTLSTGAMPAMPAIVDIRHRTILTLERIYNVLEKTADKRLVTSTLRSATHGPHTGQSEDAARQMILKNTLTVLEIYKRIVASESDMESIQHLEHITYWIHHHSDSDEIRNAAIDIKKRIDENSEYSIFKVLIGFEGIFKEWRQPGKTREEEDKIWQSEYRAIEALRDQRSKQFATEINSENFSEWATRILKYSGIQSRDMATFPFFGIFLETFGRASPELALKFLDMHRSQLGRFGTAIISGIWETPFKPNIRELLLGWVEKGEYLIETAWLFTRRDELDIELLNLIFSRAKQNANDEVSVPVLRQLILVIAANYTEKRREILNGLFCDITVELTKRQDGAGLSHVWYRTELKALIADMNEVTLDAVMANLILLNKIDHEAEQILTCIAERDAAKVINFFGNRIASKKEETRLSHFDAIPFEFHSLNKPLAKNPDLAIDAVSKWYDGNYGIFIHTGGQFLKNIFSDFPKAFEAKLLEMVATEEKDKIFIVLSVLRNFDGNIAVYGICRELVKIFEPDSKQSREVSIILQDTGVVLGEFGFVEAWKNKIVEIEPWLKDPDEKVRTFAKAYINNLNKMIAAETKRAEEEIALRKFRYGDDDDIAN